MCPRLSVAVVALQLEATVAAALAARAAAPANAIVRHGRVRRLAAVPALAFVSVAANSTVYNFVSFCSAVKTGAHAQ